MAKAKSTQSKKKSENTSSRKGLHFVKEDFSRESVIEGGVIRPLILMAAFVTFLLGMFLLLLGAQGNSAALKWGGSAVLFSFIINLQSIYSTLTDEPSYFRTLNLGFKMVLFLSEIMAFNFVLVSIL